MTPADDGIEMMRSRISRGTRQPPPPRRGSAGAGTASTSKVGEGGPERTAPPRKPSRPRHTPTPASNTDTELRPDDASANLAIRVRRPLDDRLADLIHQLRREGVRTSKVEIVEMLLHELPDTVTPGVRKRLARFRVLAPRGNAGPLDT